MSTEHTAIPSGEIHTPFQWVVADSTARNAIAPESTDANKLCLQTNDGSIWCLTVVSPATWANVGGGGGLEPFLLMGA